MKIYTKTGDKGETSLLTGNRVPKHHPRIEAYGTIDELNSFIGLLLAYNFEKESKDCLTEVQNLLFSIGTYLAMDEIKQGFDIYRVENKDIERLEAEIDRLNDSMPKLKAFIIPGGSKAIALSHVCRSVCRRAERICTYLAEIDKVEDLIIKYLNRLSDYLFVLGRKIAHDDKIDIPEWSGKAKTK